MMNIVDVAKAIAGFCVYPLLLFGAAGTLFWPEVWVLLTILFLFSAVGLRVLSREDPELLRERMSSPFQEEQKGWDKVFVPAFVLVFVAWCLLMGFDAVRFLLVAGAGLAESVGDLDARLVPVHHLPDLSRKRLLIRRSKVQKDRGPYAYVRHPMYTALLILFPYMSMLLGS